MYVSIGVMAFNEKHNIEKLLQCLLAQKLQSASVREILVISSGSTDGTNSIVTSMSKGFPVIKLLLQKKRLGKAAAVNLFLGQARSPIVVIVSADLLLKEDSLEQLIKPLKKKDVGIVGAHPMPVNNPLTFMGFAANLLWALHHEISLKKPKMGEMIAFRKIFKKIPVLSAVDEANIEPLIRGQGYKAAYAPEAIVYNKGPETIKEFIDRRRHIAAGHLCVKHEYSYEVSTLNSINIFVMVLKNIKPSWRYIFWTPLIIMLEAYSRFLGFLDYKLKLRSHTVWQVTPSTKKLVPVGKLNG